MAAKSIEVRIMEAVQAVDDQLLHPKAIVLGCHEYGEMRLAVQEILGGRSYVGRMTFLGLPIYHAWWKNKGIQIVIPAHEAEAKGEGDG